MYEHDLHPYSSRLFVTREATLKWVRSKVRKWKDGYRRTALSIEDQIFGFIGERGVGKTWLLRYLTEDYGDTSSLAVYINLDDRLAFSAAEEYTKRITMKVEQKASQQQATILILDNVPPLLWTGA